MIPLQRCRQPIPLCPLIRPGCDDPRLAGTFGSGTAIRGCSPESQAAFLYCRMFRVMLCCPGLRR